MSTLCLRLWTALTNCTYTNMLDHSHTICGVLVLQSSDSYVNATLMLTMSKLNHEYSARPLYVHRLYKGPLLWGQPNECHMQSWRLAGEARRRRLLWHKGIIIYVHVIDTLRQLNSYEVYYKVTRVCVLFRSRTIPWHWPWQQLQRVDQPTRYTWLYIMS